MTPYYYVREIEKILIALTDVFNNLRVNKYSDVSRKNVTKTVSVPIYTHSNDDFANWWSTTNSKQQLMPIPVAGIRYVGNSPDDANRVQPTYAREIFYDPAKYWIRDIQPTPYVFRFELTLLSDNLSDFFQLKENIEPYFNSYRTLRIKEFDFAPELERQIPFTIGTPSDQIDDEKNNTSNEYQFYKTTYSIECHGVMHRPYEIPAIIKYAQMDYNVDDKITDSLQVLVYPDEIARQMKQLWETVEPSIMEGYSLLKTMTRTLVKRNTVDGKEVWGDETMRAMFLTDPELVDASRPAGLNPVLVGYRKDGTGEYILDRDGDKIPIYSWDEVVVDDIERPTEVPQFDILHLKFDEDTAFEQDFSGLDRDFVAVDDTARQYVEDMQPGGGSFAPGGYAFDAERDWSQILNWFGDNAEGKITSSYTFSATLQFREIGDTIFQYLYNPEDVKLSDGTVIPAGEVWFDWGVMDSRLYFTYHTGSEFRTFKTDEYDFDTTTIYSFYFVLYDSGTKGMFGIKTGMSDVMAAIRTFEETNG